MPPQVDAANCTNPCWTSDQRNQQMIAYLLNLEYLMAESYSCWSTGVGIPDSLRGGGPPSIGCQKMAFQDPLVAVRVEASCRGAYRCHAVYFSERHAMLNPALTWPFCIVHACVLSTCSCSPGP